ncbi:GSCFA domain-containing protein [Magnetospira sp. QH-2]|uniref:GSCFA domain-containing protein n=1 Tax=Magnetospira sp. (strain QH-2) TaxID=1288970 RepID=UPI0003E818AB|nr:GSCFA domain-containing protein [Magnetospira sp. QH-2]CCQ73066.1 conserved protein of unknown function [Magnetospira sp. QH-2]
MQYKLVESYIRNLDPVRVAITPQPLINDFRCKLLSLGSCFAGFIADEMGESGFQTLYDRNGCVRFSARDTADYVNRLSQGRLGVNDDEIATTEDGSMSISMRHDRVDTVAQVGNAALKKASRQIDSRVLDFMRVADIIVVTLGTSKYLRSTTTGSPINSGLGLSKNDYEIIDQSVEEIASDLSNTFRTLRQINPNPWTGVVTVSPQRYRWSSFGDYFELDPSEYGVGSHNRDGLVANSLDKSKLRVAVEDSLNQLQDPRILYFPSFEIVMEELRHKEQFDRDIADNYHVSPSTSAYVTNRFLNTYASNEVKEFISNFNETVAPLKKKNPMTYSGYEECFTKAINSILATLPKIQNFHYIKILVDIYIDHPTKSPEIEKRLMSLKSLLNISR